MKNSIARFIRRVAVTIAAVGILASLIIGFVFIDNELTVGIGWGILVGGADFNCHRFLGFTWHFGIG